MTRLRVWAIRLAPALILGVAAALRLGALDLVPLKLDEADTLFRVRALLDRGELPISAGQMSWGLPDPPLVIFLFALPGLVARDPALAAAFLGLLDVAAVAVTCALGARVFGRRVGLSAGLLYATAPWSIYYARDLWEHIVPLFTAVALYAALEVVVRRRTRWATVFFAALALQGQTHLLAALYLPAVVLTVVAFPRRWTSPASMAGVSFGLLISGPYLLYAWALRNQFLATVSAHLSPTPAPSITALDFSLQAASGAHLEDLLGGHAAPFAPFAVGLQIVHVLLVALVAAGTGRSLLAVWQRRPGWEAYLLLPVWAWLPVAVIAFSGGPVALHYFTLLYPIPFLLAGVGLWPVSHSQGFAATRTCTAAGVAVVQAASLAALASLLPRVELGGAVGVPAGVWERVATEARELAPASETSELHIRTQGADPDYADYPSALAYVLGPDLRARFLNGASIAIPQDRPALYLDLLGDPTGSDLLERLGQQVAQAPLPGGWRSARFYLLRARSADELAALPSHPQSEDLSYGLHFLGYDLPDTAWPAGRLVVTTYWFITRVGDAERNGDLAFFHHLVDADGRMMAQHDGVGLPSHLWRKDDLLIEREILDLSPRTPAGDYHLLIGAYSRRDGHRAQFRGRDVDALDLGSVHVVP